MRPSLSEAMVAICSADWKSSPFPQDSLREASESWTVALQTPAWGGIHTCITSTQNFTIFSPNPPSHTFATDRLQSDYVLSDYGP